MTANAVSADDSSSWQMSIRSLLAAVLVVMFVILSGLAHDAAAAYLSAGKFAYAMHGSCAHSYLCRSQHG